MDLLPPILIVDDDPDDLFILKRLLAKAGVKNKVLAIEDAPAAVAYLEAESANPASRYIPWMIFTDLHMPRIDGIDFVKWIRSKPAFQHLIVIMVSSSEDPQDKAKALQAGVNRFALKYPNISTLATWAEEFRPVMKLHAAA